MIFDRALEVLRGTPPVFTALIENLPPGAEVLRPGEGAWSPAEVLAHLLHQEVAGLAPRLRRLSLQNHLPWEATPPTPPPGELREMLSAFVSARAENLRWASELTPEQRQHVLDHPHWGPISVDVYVAEWAYHDLDHLRQILGALAAELYPHIGTFQELYTPPR